ncbi:hypothetical protein [Nereida sp. MMG025]|uniref:hypothetical protein n=1 Tax=Nereida sp. MMG025 TaxID=2909981 RepID=UPI001F1E093E|nr:hypothetical protein [Nereida sp. MMG025]MCF6444575.1 hypothetical protein [Nereida sp. MMG025]
MAQFSDLEEKLRQQSLLVDKHQQTEQPFNSLSSDYSAPSFSKYGEFTPITVRSYSLAKNADME